MKWLDKFWTGYGMVVDTIISLTADTLNAVGSLACIIGGGGFGLSYAIDESLKTSYYGSGLAYGQVDVNINAPTINYSLNETLYFDQHMIKEGELQYYLQNYLMPSTLRSVSSIIACSGTALRLLGDNIKPRAQMREDNIHLKRQYGIEMTHSTFKEHLYLSAKSLCSSFTYITVSYTCTGIFINYSGFTGSSQNITYPSMSEEIINTTTYQGPVANAQIPFEYTLEKNFTVQVWGNNIFIEGTANVLGWANLTYGGGLFFKSNSKPDSPIGASAALALTAYLAHNFFNKKAVRERDIRMLSAQQSPYLSIQDIPDIGTEQTFNPNFNC